MNREVTITQKQLITGAVVAILAIVAYVIAGPSPVKTATAAGGDPATACVAPALSSASTVADEPTLETVAPPVVTEHTHDSDGVKQKGLVNVNDTTVKDVVDVSTGDILSNNLNNNEVDVSVTDVLNPVTSLLSTVKVL